jgi:hypothetical protein
MLGLLSDSIPANYDTSCAEQTTTTSVHESRDEGVDSARCDPSYLSREAA